VAQEVRAPNRFAKPPEISPRPDHRSPVTDHPSLPQQIVPDLRYITVEGNAFARAYEWSCEHTVRKYPGATEVLATLDSLIRQKLNAENE
jgi:hypothetical protein